MEQTSLEKTSRYGKDVIWNLIGQFSYLFSLWLITILTTRMIGYEAQGVLSLALVAGNICTSFANYYLRLQYASDINGRFKDRDYVFARFFLTALSIFVCVGYCFMLGYSLATIGSILLFYIYKVFEMLSDILQGVMQRHGRLYIGGYTMTAKGVISVGVFAAIAALTGNLNLALIGIALVAGVCFALDLFLAIKVTPFKILPFKFSWKTLGTLLVLCFPLFLLHLGCNVLPSLPRIFFERMYSETELGYYASIANIAVLIQTAASAIMIPLVPKISSYYKSKQTSKFLKFDAIIVGSCLVLGGIALLLVHFLGEWALKLVYGEEIVPYVNTFLPTAIAAIMTALVIIATQILGAMEKRVWAAICVGVGTGICAAISYLFCREFYMNGISYALIISEGVAVVACLFFVIFFRKPKTTSTNNETL